MKYFGILGLIHLILLYTLVFEAESKYFKKRVSFTKKKEFQYLTKFGISQDPNEKGSWSRRARLKRPFDPPADYKGQNTLTFNIFLYLDNNWFVAQDEPVCSKKGDYAIRKHEITIPFDGTWSEEPQGGLRQRTRPYVWYVGVSDCNGNLHQSIKGLPPIEIELVFKGLYETEFSHEEIGLLSLYVLVLILFLGLLFTNIFKYYEEYRRSEKIDSPMLMLSISIGIEVMSILMQTFHLCKYSYDGQGIVILDLMSIMAEVAAQFSMTLLLILISWGWTLTYRRFADIDLYIPLIGLLLMVHLVIGGLTYITNDAASKYHDFEGVQGILLICVRIGMFAYFIYGYKITYPRAILKVKNFLDWFVICGGIYLLAFPFFCLIALVCAHYIRHKVIVIGNLLMQLLAMAFLHRVFTKKNNYTEIAKTTENVLPLGNKY